MKHILATACLCLATYPSFAQDNIPEPPTGAAASADPAPKLQDRFYADLGFPLLFNVTTSPAPDPVLNGGLGSYLPNGAWSSGLAINAGFEKALSPRLSAFLEAGLMTMDINQLLVESNEFPPTKAGAVLFNFLLGLKIGSASEKLVNPYFTVGLGCSKIHIGSLNIPSLSTTTDEYDGLRFLAGAAAGIDVRCDDEMTAFFEFKFYNMDTLHLFAQGTDLSLCLFRSGLRMVL